MDQINMADLPLVSKTGWWIVRTPKNKKYRAEITIFRAKFKAAFMNYELCKKQYGADAKMTINANKKYAFYENQINKDESDIFSLLMYNTSEWCV